MLPVLRCAATRVAIAVAFLTPLVAICGEKQIRIDCTGYANGVKLFSYPSFSTQCTRIPCQDAILLGRVKREGTSWANVRTKDGVQGFVNSAFIAPRDAVKEIPCRVTFAIVTGQQPVSGWSRDQADWWITEGRKRYKGVCLASGVDSARYAVVWGSRDTTYEYERRVPVTEQTTTVGSASTPSGNVGYSEVSTTTKMRTKREQATITFVSVAVYRVTGEDWIKASPIYTSNQRTKWIWSKPTKDALIDALLFLSSQGSLPE